MVWTTSYHHYDAQGSTRQLTDSTETVTDTYNYDAFGNELSHTGSTKNPFRWNGRWGYHQDGDTGTYQVRQRPYSPVVAVFVAKDIVWPLDSNNPFAYVANNPVNLVDPSGRLAWNNLPTKYTLGGPPLLVKRPYGGPDRTEGLPTLAETVPRLDIAFSCCCGGPWYWRMWSLCVPPGITVSFRNEVYIWRHYPDPGQTAWVLRAEGDHVTDYSAWAAGPGLRAAQGGEVRAAGPSYFTRSGCGTGTRNIMLAAISPSLVIANNATVFDHDKSGSHDWGGPSQRP